LNIPFEPYDSFFLFAKQHKFSNCSIASHQAHEKEVGSKIFHHNNVNYTDSMTTVEHVETVEAPIPEVCFNNVFNCVLLSL
jgi:hypothetical protein